MKQIFSFLAFLFILSVANAQAPQGIPYQAAARNSSGAVLASTAISVRFSIRDISASGTFLYRETHSTTTDANGMFSVNIGQGTPVSGTFASINWGTNAKFMQVELDPAGGSSYIDLGTQQMMSVPYSMYSNNGFTPGIAGDIMLYNGTNWVKLPAGTAGQVLTMSTTGLPAWSIPLGLTIGSTYGGGKVAYILQPSDPGYIAGEIHGLIAATNDQSTGTPWGCLGTTVGGTSPALGAGIANTTIVSAACGAGTAARLCSDLVLNGFSDWYLPSREEVQKLYVNRGLIGGFTTGIYLSSTESNSIAAWTYSFADGSPYTVSKSLPAIVRAVRSF